MSIKGFRSLQRLQSKLAGFSLEQSIDDALYATVQYINGKRGALDTVIHGGYKVSVAPLTVGANSNIRVINCVAHGAQPGDYLTFVASNIEVSVLSVPDANTIITSHELTFDPTGLTFNVFRHVTPTYNSDGTLITTAPVGGATSANQVLELAQLTTIATNTGKAQTGLFDEDLTVSTTPETFTAPAGAFACFIEADDTNTTNARIKMGGTASTTSGIQFQGGRSEFYQGGSNISYCMESGAGKLSVQWFIKV